MGDRTKIEWTSATWNPVTGCRKVSPGCAHCYAERFAARGLGVWGRTITAEGADGYPKDYHDVRPFTEVRCHPERLDAPLRWRKPRRVFVNSMSDLFHEDVPYTFIREVFNVMRCCDGGIVAATGKRRPAHTFQVLTKRPERIRELARSRALGFDPDNPPQNVWLGVSVEDQQRADERVPLLLDTPAAVRFVSAEPLLGPVDLTRWVQGGPSRFTQGVVDCPACEGRGWQPVYEGDVFTGGTACTSCEATGAVPRLDWIIVGGESGPGARPMDLAWARSLVKQGRAAGCPTFVKQLGRSPLYRDGDRSVFLNLRDRKGGDPDEWPPDLRVREFPA